MDAAACRIVRQIACKFTAKGAAYLRGMQKNAEQMRRPNRCTSTTKEAAFFGEHDTLTGITENIIFGQLAPYGTGSVDLIVDQKAL